MTTKAELTRAIELTTGARSDAIARLVQHQFVIGMREGEVIKPDSPAIDPRQLERKKE